MRQWPGTRAVTCHVSRYKTECGQAHSRVCQTSYTTACQHSVTLDCRTEHSEVGHVSNILHYHVHVSHILHCTRVQECTEESTVQCYTAEECAPVAATNCVSRPREVCEEVPVQDCR